MTGRMDWQTVAEEGLFRDLTFTEEMKANVLEKVRKDKRAGKWLFVRGNPFDSFSWAGLAVVFVVGVLFLWQFGMEWLEQNREASGVQSVQDETDATEPLDLDSKGIVWNQYKMDEGAKERLGTGDVGMADGEADLAETDGIIGNDSSATGPGDVAEESSHIGEDFGPVAEEAEGIAEEIGDILDEAGDGPEEAGSGMTDSLMTESGESWTVTYQVLQAPILQKGESINASDPDILPGLSNKHNPLRMQAITDKLAMSEVELTDSQQVNGFGTLVRYKLRSADHPLAEGPSGDASFFGFVPDGFDAETVYHVGYGHMYDAVYYMTRLFGMPVLKGEILECRYDGEDCAWYFALDKEGPQLVAMFEARTFEKDLDGDGSEEAIVSTNKLNQVYIFKKIGNELHWASIRDALELDNDHIVHYEPASGRILSLSRKSGLYTMYKYVSE